MAVSEQVTRSSVSEVVTVVEAMYHLRSAYSRSYRRSST